MRRTLHAVAEAASFGRGIPPSGQAGSLPHGDASPPRRGTAMIIAIIALLLVSAISFSLVRIALAARQQAERQQWRWQSVWLAESALAEAAVRLRGDPDFPGETWKLDSGPGGKVVVKIAAEADDPRRRTITATADVPDDPVDRVRITRTLTLTLPETAPAATD